MDAPAIRAALETLEGWETAPDGKSVSKAYAFADFAQALAFVDRVGALAEAADHHPDIALSWGKAAITLSTHSAGGVTEKDIELARKIDEL